ncbi:non-ribosomal peptide synthetase [Aspergillus ibericus CBS 121593]|uniref:Non-ribosomal peptide synthetase n=1 Tax=Aspergillus ibericus CBS 121593 TaxID=1448316 RepID=A0A395GK17_9EURO|nr:non-ribosomal peptide synthetase [Aspergillus ibericus CBS 121593]RAK95831.1 non-ribosomal peptide synthetase [Aspergillus ibericus CBS 121593]
MSPSLIISEIKEDVCHSGLGLAGLLHQQATVRGSAVAIEEGQHELTYGDLHDKALFVANQIDCLNHEDPSPVGIIIPRSMNHVLSQAGVIYSGRACVPLDNKLPDEMLKDMLHNLGSTLVITDMVQQHRLPGFKHLVVDHRAIPDNFQAKISPSQNGPQTCSHVFHTSGTTGKPKAVEAFAEGMINLVLDPAELIRKGQRVGHGSNIIFDTSLVEIWGPLLRGATMVVVPMETVLDPTALSTFVKEKELNVLQLTTSLLTVTAYACPDAFSTLDTLITGGEAINCQTIQSIFDAGAPGRIINGYGPTEASVYVLWHDVSEEEARRGEIPVGKPFGNVEVFLVDDHLGPVQPGEVGELLVSGVGVAGGYIGDPEKTAKSFLYMPQMRRKVERGPKHMYRTGDLMRMDDNGIYYYLGRKDNQIKIRGQRVELEALESALVGTGLVSAAVVVKITPEEVDRGQFLLAYCIPSAPGVAEGAIMKTYMEQAPHLMVPRLELIDVLPLRSTGKVDRRALEDQYHQKLKRSRANGVNGNANAGRVAAKLEYIWIDVFGLTVEHLRPTDDFVVMGGTSLIAATMIARIKQTFGISLRAQMLYENTSFEKLTQLVTNIQVNGDDSTIQAEQDVWLQDSKLAEHLRPMGGVIPHWPDKNEGRIFLTGATGFVGVFLLATLVKRPDVKKVACLVRAEDQSAARRRLEKCLEKYCLSADMDKVIAVPGNFGQPKLGLSPEQYDYFATWASVIFHLGAKVSYVAPYSSHRQENTIGTLNMLEFSTHCRIKAMHYSSTIAAYGPTGHVTGAKLLLEDERPAPHLAALPSDTGYAQSQYVAEAIVWNAIDNGFPVAIYRPGFVLGHSKSGICNPDDFISRLFTSCMDMGLYPVLPDQRKEFIPVDYVVDAILHVSLSHDNLGHGYNLVQPDLANAIDINTTFDLLNQMSPYQMEGVPYEQWVNSLSERLDDPLHPLTPMLREKVFGEKTRWEVYENMAEYGRENIRRALSDAPEILNREPIEVLFQRSLKSWLPCLVWPKPVRVRSEAERSAADQTDGAQPEANGIH